MPYTQAIICNTCKVEKPLDEYYDHPFGRFKKLTKCKECHKEFVRNNYVKNIHRYKEYYKNREKTERRKAQRIEIKQRRRLRSPEKHKAHYAVSNAVRDGRIKRLPCQVCGNPESQAHHYDYSKPLDVVWLCFEHHMEVHGKVAYSKRKQKMEESSA